MNKAFFGVLGLVGLLSVGCIAAPDIPSGGAANTLQKSPFGAGAPGAPAAEGSQGPRGPQGSENAGGGPGAAGPGGAIDANTRYVPEMDAAKAQAIATRMWGILTAAQCWHMQNSNDNYTFSGVNDYRYAGYETTAGKVGLSSVGTFGGYDMADVTISRTQYWIGIYDARTIAMSFVHDNGKLVTNWFTAAAPGQYCL